MLARLEQWMPPNTCMAVFSEVYVHGPVALVMGQQEATELFDGERGRAAIPDLRIAQMEVANFVVTCAAGCTVEI
jgi:hypothetical protein